MTGGWNRTDVVEAAASGLPDLLQLAADLLTGMGTLGLGFAAIWAIAGGYQKAALKIEEKKLEYALSEHTRKLAFDVSIELVEAIEAFREAISQVRSPFGWSEESKEADRMRSEAERGSDWHGSKSKGADICLLRISQHGDAFERLFRLTPRVEAVYGQCEVIDECREILWDIRFAAMDLQLGVSEGERDKQMELRRTIMSTGRNDPLGERISNVLMRAKAMASPYLSPVPQNAE